MKVKDPNDIWDEEEIEQSDLFIDDGRQVPEYIMYKQHVGSEDVYLGMGNTTPSTVVRLPCHTLTFPGRR